jgi:tRNA nucleotidyltransferase (CCA-adding enzyme)
MKIITTHERADMDALASMYAAWLLYPDHQVVLPQKLNRNVRDLLALYREEMPFLERSAVARRRVAAVLLVDTQAIAPLRGMDAQTRVHIVDHHPLSGGEEAGKPLVGAYGDTPPPTPSPLRTYEGEVVGATTTLLVEKMRAQALRLNKVGASVLLMGIYEDTGSLSYLTTTARDAQAAGWLLEQGADLALVVEFMNRPLSDAQRATLAQLISAITMHTLRGHSICVAAITLNEYVDELSTLIHQIVAIYEPEACFMLALFGESIQIIARSTVAAVDVARLLREFGGGGHSKAAAALVRGTDLAGLRDRLLSVLEQQVEPPVPVRDIMSTNVHTLNLDMAVRDAGQLMRRYGHEGFPVVEGERLVGVLTRRDIDRALHHRLGDMPVRSLLHTGPAFVHPYDSVDEVQRVMIEHDLGQVPVVEEGRLVGLVTRTDVIKLWATPLSPSRAQELRRLLEEALPSSFRELLLATRDVANDLGYSLYVVGGFVRDLLLGAPTLDLDLVVEGDAIALAHKLAGKLGGRVRSHARFGTAKIILEGERGAGWPPSLDFVTARTEFYERPTVLPQVERSSIKQDLYRRDFTINTLAICLDRARYGELLDYYGGERDLRERCIRVLHNLSFVEDPTRILRAVRFEQRLGFAIEPRTAELMDDALELLDHITGERLRHELYLLLAEAEPERGLDRLARLGALAHLHPHIRFTRDTAQLFARLRARLRATLPAAGEPSGRLRVETPAEEGEAENAPELLLCYLALLTSSMNASEMASFAEHLRLSHHDARLLHEVVRLRESLSPLSARAMLPSSIYHLLEPFSREARFVLSVLTEAEVVLRRLDLYERQLAHVAPRIDGHFLRALGVPPGPVYGEILTRVQDALLDGQVHTEEEEQALARALVEALNGREGHPVAALS